MGKAGNLGGIEHEAGFQTRRAISRLEAELTRLANELATVRRNASTVLPNASIAVRENSGTFDVGVQPRLNFIEGTGITLGVVNDSLDDEIDITVTRNTINLGTDVTGDLPFANLTQASAASKLLGRGDSGAGDYQEISLGSNLSMTGTTLAAAGVNVFDQRATQNLASAAATISVTDGSPVTPLTSSGSYTLTAAPLIAAGRDGQLAILVNTNASYTLTFTDISQIGFGGAGIRLQATTRTLQPLRGLLALIYDATLGAWCEHYYSSLLTFTPSISTMTIDGSSAASREVAAASTADAVPSFALTYVGVPSACSINIDAGGGEISGSDYPISVPSPYTSLTSGTTPPSVAFYRGTSVSQVRTFTATATVSGTAGLTKTCTVTYTNRRYIGPLASATINTAQILGLDGAGGTSDLTNSSAITATVSTTTGEYVWYAHRSALTTMTYMSVSGEIAGFTDTGTLSHTNDYGFAEPFRAYRSTLTNFGASKSVVFTTSRPTNRVYMGPSTAADPPTPITSAQILDLDGAGGTSVLSTTPAGSYAVTISGSNYLWFCHPDAISDLVTIKDNSTGFAVAGSYRTDVSHTNDMGYTETYRCWRSDNVGIFPSGGTVVVGVT